MACLSGLQLERGNDHPWSGRVLINSVPAKNAGGTHACAAAVVRPCLAAEVVEQVAKEKEATRFFGWLPSLDKHLGDCEVTGAWVCIIDTHVGAPLNSADLAHCAG